MATAFGTFQLTSAPEDSVPAAAFAIPAAVGFIGEWTTTNPTDDHLGHVSLLEEGRYSSVARRGEEVIFRSNGKWFLRAGSMIWIHDGNSGTEDVNPIVEYSADRFQLKEQDGSVTTFVRVL